jgi:hypothetical protein
MTSTEFGKSSIEKRAVPRVGGSPRRYRITYVPRTATHRADLGVARNIFNYEIQINRVSALAIRNMFSRFGGGLLHRYQ